MYLKRLNLINFRNYSALTLDFDKRPTILIGNNAAGKSNLLESIYLMSTTKSLRVEREEELIKDGEQFSRVEGFLVEGEMETELQVLINHPTEDLPFKKKVLVNGISKRVYDFIGNLPAVIFYPQDINMITGAPSLRRWHLDLALAQIDQDYKKALTLYGDFLTARNKVLKRIREGFSKLDELDFWTSGLLENAEVVSKKREEFFKFINNLEKPLGEFQFDFRPSLISLEKLKATNGREVAAAQTLIGPHRDDFDIVVLSEVEGSRRNMASHGSRGEQRTATLAFKLSQLEYMSRAFGKRPILLLDDVFSELDGEHRATVVEIVGKQQTIIATVELENIPKEFLDSARILHVENGKIIT